MFDPRHHDPRDQRERRAHPDARLRIVGYTCELGADVYNQSLSLQRALGVKQVMIELGVAADRLEVEGRGELDPMQAFMAGRVQVQGDMTLMLQMQAVLMQAMTPPPG